MVPTELNRWLFSIKPKLVGESVDAIWEKIDEIMMKTAEDEIGFRQEAQKHNLLITEIMTLYEERRKCKNLGNREDHSDIQKSLDLKYDQQRTIG